MIDFAWPYLFAVLPLPLLVALLCPRASQRPASALRLPFFAAIQSEEAPLRLRRFRLRLALALLAWVLLVLAASRPLYVGEPLQLPLSGRDLLLAVDISGSMRVEDMILAGKQTTRLRVVKALAGDFIERRQGDRIGLILFGDQAYLQTPLTFDRITVRTLLYEAEIGLAGRQTAIGDAIGLAVKRLRHQPQENRVLILLTDGANTAGEVEPLQAAQLAALADLRIYTIGVGADEMVIQGLYGAVRIRPSANLDEETLIAVANATGGRYFRARDTASLAEIYRLLDELEPVPVDEETFRPIRELYPWPLAASLSVTGVLALTASGLFGWVASPRKREA